MAQYQTLLYYCYRPIDNAEQFAADHLEFCKLLSLVSQIIVVVEGVMGSVADKHEDCKGYIEAVHADPRFAHMDFKVDDVPEPSFIKMHGRYKPEIVHSGLRDRK